MLHIFQSMLKKSIKNLQACAKVGLIPILLQALPSFENEEVAGESYSCFSLNLNRIDIDSLIMLFNVLKFCEIIRKVG